jgi:hypothetical protein
MNLSINDIAKSIEAHYEGVSHTAKDVVERLNYLTEMLEKASNIINFKNDELVYAIGDTLNLLELIKTKLK